MKMLVWVDLNSRPLVPLTYWAWEPTSALPTELNSHPTVKGRRGAFE